MSISRVSGKGNFVILTFGERLLKHVVITSKINKLSHNDFMRAFNVLRNSLMQLSGLGGRLAFILIRRGGNIECHLLVYKSALIGSLQSWASSIMSLLSATCNLASIEVGAASDGISNSVLLALPWRILVYRAYQGIKIRELENQLSTISRHAQLRSSINESAMGDLLKKELLMKHFWRDMEDGDIMLFIIDLGRLASTIRKYNTKISNLTKKPRNKGFELASIPRRETLECEIKFGLYAGKVLNPFDLSADVNSEGIRTRIASDKFYSLCQKTLALPLLILGRQSDVTLKRRAIDSSTILHEIANGDNNVTVSASLDTLLNLLTIIALIFVSSKSTMLDCPQLSVSSHATRGDVYIGWQLQGGERVAPFYIRMDDLRRHVVILGRTGSGKTRLARVIIEQLLNLEDVRIWIFDFHREYIDLLRDGSFEVYEPGTLERPLCLNMFESVEEEPESYSTFLASVLLETVRLKGEEVTAQMERALSHAVWSTVTSEEPNPKTFLRKLFDWCRSAEEDLPSAMYTFYAVTNRLKPIFSGVSKYIFWVFRSNIDIDRMLKKNVIFDLSYLFKRNLKLEILLLVNVLMRYLTMALFQSARLVESEEPPKLVVVVEEGRYLIPWRRTSSTIETTAIEDFATLARKYGLSLIVLSQSPYLISPDIISNAGTLFLMNSEVPEREYTIISDDNLRRFIQVMPPRQAIVKLSTEPTLVHVEIKTHEIKGAPQELPVRVEPLALIEKDFEECIKELLE